MPTFEESVPSTLVTNHFVPPRRWALPIFEKMPIFLEDTVEGGVLTGTQGTGTPIRKWFRVTAWGICA